MDLKIQVRNEIENLEKELDIISLLNNKYDIEQLDEIEIRGASLSLAAMYNGIERILSDILKDKVIRLEGHESWHKLVLDEALKSKLISTEMFNELKGFLAFRHFVRHAYSFEIEPKTVQVIIKKAPTIVRKFIEEIIDLFD